MSDSQIDDFLAHHGVLGMKWGSRKGGSGGASGKSERHAARASARAARASDRSAQNKLIDKQTEVDHKMYVQTMNNKVPKHQKIRSADIIAARERQTQRADLVDHHIQNYLNQSTEAGKRIAQKHLDKAVDAYTNNADEAISKRSTGREKLAVGAGLAAVGLSAASLAGGYMRLT